jgi:hypothetical protein
LHFGLGSHTSVDLEVHWPNGLVEPFKHVPINQLITLREGVGPVANRGWAKTQAEKPGRSRQVSPAPNRKLLENT